jgi:hypothetical protein
MSSAELDTAYSIPPISDDGSIYVEIEPISQENCMASINTAWLPFVEDQDEIGYNDFGNRGDNDG